MSDWKKDSSKPADWRIDIADPENGSVVFPGLSRVPPELKALATRIADEIRKSAHKDGTIGFRVEVDGVRYRIQHMNDSRYAARMIRSTIPTFDDLGIRAGYRAMLLNPQLRKQGGLVMICGLPGAGKTSTSVALVKEILTNYGGYCLTVEDPPEYAMEGFHGEQGYCEQIDAGIMGYPSALALALRCFPSQVEHSILMFGEIRSGSDAAELLRIALDGHLVISTLHASDPIVALQRLISLSGMEGEGETKSLLASSLRLVLHQTLKRDILRMAALEGTPMVLATIQNGNVANLQDEVIRTQARLEQMVTR